MKDKVSIREIAIGLGLGLLANIISAFLLEQTKIYIFAVIFVFVVILYYVSWLFVIKPLSANRKVRLKDAFTNYESAKSSVISAVQESSNIRIMSVGGSAITADDRGRMLDLLSTRAQAGARIKILLLNPESTALEARFEELNRMKFTPGQPDDMRRHLADSADKILTSNESIQLRYYDTKPVWRLYVLDRWAFVSSYLGDREGHNTNVIMLERGSDLFSAVERYFDSIWETSHKPTGARIAQTVTQERNQTTG